MNRVDKRYQDYGDDDEKEQELSFKRRPATAMLYQASPEKEIKLRKETRRLTAGAAATSMKAKEETDQHCDFDMMPSFGEI